MTADTVPRQVHAVHPGASRIVVWVALGCTSWAALVSAVVLSLRLVG